MLLREYAGWAPGEESSCLILSVLTASSLPPQDGREAQLKGGMAHTGPGAASQEHGACRNSAPRCSLSQGERTWDPAPSSPGGLWFPALGEEGFQARDVQCCRPPPQFSHRPVANKGAISIFICLSLICSIFRWELGVLLSSLSKVPPNNPRSLQPGSKHHQLSLFLAKTSGLCRTLP